MVIGPLPGPAPAAPRAREELLGELVELAHMPEGNERRNVPRVEGAMMRWPSTSLVGAAAQQVGVVDAVATRDYGVDQSH
jgi:hypothetical protein